MYVVGVILRVVVLDYESRALHAVVVSLVDFAAAPPAEMNLVHSRRFEGLASLSFDVDRHVLEILGQQFAEQFLLVRTHFRSDQAHGGRCLRLSDSSSTEIIRCCLIDPSDLLLISVTQLKNLPRHILFWSKYSDASAKSGVDRSRIRSEEFGSTRCHLAVFDRVVQRDVMPFQAPAPSPSWGRRSEDAEVILLWVAFLASLITCT